MKMKAGPKKRQYEPVSEWEALGYFIEEAGEALAAAGKTVRWGWYSYNPEPNASRETNVEWLRREVADLEEAIKRLRHLSPVGEASRKVRVKRKRLRAIDDALPIAQAIAEWDQDEHPEVYKDDFAYDRMVTSFKDAGARMVKALKGDEK